LNVATLADLQTAVNAYTTSLATVSQASAAKQQTAAQVASAQTADAAAGEALGTAQTDLNSKASALKSVIDTLTASPPS
jgi:hypothetical protein